MKTRELKEPLISIITVNYNQGQTTHELLLSIEQLTYKKLEVIVVDNGSKEDLSSILSPSYDILELNIIKSKTNLGFAGGNNLGIGVSKGKYLFFVNNDTELDKNCLQPLLKRFESDSSIGMISSKIRYFYTPNIIQYAGFSPIHPFTARNYGIGHKEVDYGQHDIGKITNYAHGAAMMIKREIISTVGIMPEVFFLYYEELDWCEQIKRAGYNIYYEPESLIYHKESMTVGKNSSKKTYYLTRNRILFIKRNFSKIYFYIFLLNFTVTALPKNALQFLLQKDFKLFKAFLKGYLWNLKNFNSNSLIKPHN